MKKAKLEYAIKLQEREKVRKQNIANYFTNFIVKYHRPWLQRLADAYKERGEFPMFPIVILPSYYEDIRDKEVAAFAALLINENGGFERVLAFKEMLGESPWDWFEKRYFVKLSLGSVQNERTGGVENWKIARLFDRLWCECHVCDYEIPNFENPWITYKQSCVANIGNIVHHISNIQYCSYFDALTYLVEDCGVGNYYYKLRLLLMLFCSSDGFGLAQWHSNVKDELKCPLALGVRQFVETWFPDYKRLGDVDRAIKLFGLNGECDFFYAFWGYKELQKRNPAECSLYATRYNTWYALGSRVKKYKWEGFLPKISF